MFYIYNKNHLYRISPLDHDHLKIYNKYKYIDDIIEDYGEKGRRYGNIFGRFLSGKNPFKAFI